MIILDTDFSVDFDEGVRYHITNAAMYVDAHRVADDDGVIVGWILDIPHMGESYYEDFISMRQALADLDVPVNSHCLRNISRPGGTNTATEDRVD